jgi:hypothetical protein
MHFSNQWTPRNQKTQRRKKVQRGKDECILLSLSRNHMRLNHVNQSRAQGLPVGC